jgi:phosphopantetheinyl transferase (holo-ACP synthase)
MIVGVGIDIIGDSDFQKRIDRSPSLLVSLLSLSHNLDVNTFHANSNEIDKNSQTDIQRAKSNLVSIEAMFKALPSNLRSNLDKLKISRDELGKPSIVYLGLDKEVFDQFAFHVSISHDFGVTIGVVIIESV